MTDEKILEDDDEPVGWLYEMCDNPDVYVSPDSAFSWFQKGRYTIPLYTRPAPARKPLSEDEIRSIMLANGFTIKDGCEDLKPYVYAAVRAIEKMHGIGETE